VACYLLVAMLVVFVFTKHIIDDEGTMIRDLAIVMGAMVIGNRSLKK
jgi:hypothetical protein